jgi:hypothetical protein
MKIHVLFCWSLLPLAVFVCVLFAGLRTLLIVDATALCCFHSPSLLPFRRVPLCLASLTPEISPLFQCLYPPTFYYCYYVCVCVYVLTCVFLVFFVYSLLPLSLPPLFPSNKQKKESLEKEMNYAQFN